MFSEVEEIRQLRAAVRIWAGAAYCLFASNVALLIGLWIGTRNG